ncbi:MAG: glycosyltransferase [Clostridia bacterium]|nr:glycosyltransferase [Clostridia bacterium]
MNKVLILSCNTGQGHNSTANALKEVLDAKGINCNIDDALRFISEAVSNFIAEWHVKLYRKMPKAFDAGYRFTENHTDALFDEKSLLYKLFTSGSEKLNDYCRAGEYDAVICTHSFSAMMLTDVIKKYSLDVLTAFVATDYSVAPGLEQSDMDVYFIPDESLKEDFTDVVGNKNVVIASGIPVRQSFIKAIDRAEAKKALGICANNKHIIMMCGSMGCGPMKAVAGELAKILASDCELTVICGTNQKMQHQIEEICDGHGNIHVKGYVDDVSLMMDSADLYITKPGGISVTEAAVKGLPMVLIDAVAGCETYNLSFFVERGMAVTGDTPAVLASLCSWLLDNDDKLKEMSANLSLLKYADAAQFIVEYLQKKNES